MSFCLPLAYWQDAAKKKAARENSVQEPLLGGQVWWGAGMAAWGGVSVHAVLSVHGRIIHAVGGTHGEWYPCCREHAWESISMLWGARMGNGIHAVESMHGKAYPCCGGDAVQELLLGDRGEGGPCCEGGRWGRGDTVGATQRGNVRY